jgi:hypothetical protein
LCFGSARRSEHENGESGNRQEQSSEILHGGSFSLKMTECFASLLSSSRIVTYDEKIFSRRALAIGEKVIVRFCGSQIPARVEPWIAGRL